MGGDGSGRPKKPPVMGKLIKDIVPINDIFDEDEQVMYKDLLSVYLQDFDDNDLTSSDFDDIISLATNKVLSYRLLKDSKGDPDKQLDISSAIEKMDRRCEKIKESLSSRRKDRVDPNALKGFSIVDLAVAYDNEARAKHAKRLEKMRGEEKEMLVKRKNYHGNRNDASENEERNDE